MTVRDILTYNQLYLDVHVFNTIIKLYKHVEHSIGHGLSNDKKENIAKLSPMY